MTLELSQAAWDRDGVVVSAHGSPKDLKLAPLSLMPPASRASPLYGAPGDSPLSLEACPPASTVAAQRAKEIKSGLGAEPNVAF